MADAAERPYYYHPLDDDDADDAHNANGGPSRLDACGTTAWTGRRQRYAWVDLRATACSFGPYPHGEGRVSKTSFPQLVAAASTQAEGYAGVLKEPVHTAGDTVGYAASIAQLVHRSARTLIFPPMLRFPVPFVHNIVIRLIVMQDDGGGRGKVDKQDSLLYIYCVCIYCVLID